MEEGRSALLQVNGPRPLWGKDFPPHPHFLRSCGGHGVMWFFPSGSRRRLCRLTCPPPAANSSSRFALRQRAFAALRSPASHLLLAPLLPQRSSFTSAPRRIPRLLCRATSAPRRIPRLLCRAEASRGIHFHGQLSGLLRYMVGVLGFEPRTSSLSGTRSNQLSYTPIRDYRSLNGCGLVKWWSRRDSYPKHPACKAGALAIELRPRSHVVSPSGILT